MAWFVDATNLALKLMGDTIASNMFMVGYAAQQALLPVSVEALEKAITLNGIAVDFNLTRFDWAVCSLTIQRRRERCSQNQLLKPTN